MDLPSFKRQRTGPNIDCSQLTYLSDKSKGHIDEKIKINSDLYKPIWSRFDTTNLWAGEFPCKFIGMSTSVSVSVSAENPTYRFESFIEPNTIFNDLVISIPNPYKLDINSLVQSIRITDGNNEYIKISGDIATHIEVLGKFTNTWEKYDENTSSTKISIGLFPEHSGLIKYKYFNMVFEISTMCPNPLNIKFFGKLQKLMPETNQLISNLPNRPKEVLFYQIQTQAPYPGDKTYCWTEHRTLLKFNHPVNFIYLDSIDPNLVSSITMRVNGFPIIQFTAQELDDYNLAYHKIDTKQIVIVFEPKPLTSNNGSINFSRIDQIDLEVKTTNGISIPYNINGFNTNMLEFVESDGVEYFNNKLYAH
jgi:hypothetical protein